MIPNEETLSLLHGSFLFVLGHLMKGLLPSPLVVYHIQYVHIFIAANVKVLENIRFFFSPDGKYFGTG